MQKAASKTLGVDPSLVQLGFYGCIHCDFGASIAAAPKHGADACFLCQFGDDFLGAAFKNIKAAAKLFDTLSQSSQRMVQPPARSATEGAKALALFIEDVDAQKRGTCSSGAEGRVVRNAQIIPKPHDRRGRVVGFTKRCHRGFCHQ